MFKTCKQCGEEKAARKFYKQKQNRDGYRKECKDCYNLNTRTRRSKERIELVEYRTIKQELKTAKLRELRLQLEQGLTNGSASQQR
jgi:hypothetical protein